MEARCRIGDVLGRMGQLSSHDIDEILAEQRATGARFGEIALALGLVQPEHVWAAWVSQVSAKLERVDLEKLGIDAQAVDCLPRDLAVGLGAMPLRHWEGRLVVAVTDAARASALAERTGLRVHCVLADAGQIARALAEYYPAATRAAAG